MTITCIIGASRGIGYELTKQLAKKTAHTLIVTATDQANLAKLITQFPSVAFIPATLDLGSQTSLENFIALCQKYPIDNFVGNGAVLPPIAPLSQLSFQDWHQAFQTNTLAYGYLLGHLTFTSKAHITLVTSRAVEKCRAKWALYAASKAALNTLTQCFANENPDLFVNLFDPGAVRTTMRAKAWPDENPLNIPKASVAATALYNTLTLNQTNKLIKLENPLF